MLKDTIIAIFDVITGAVFSGLRQARSRIRWWKICLRDWPAELAQRRRRRQMMREYIQRLREMPQEGRQKQIEEVE